MTGMLEKKYALALFELATEENSLEAICDEVKLLKQILDENSEYIKALSVPTLNFLEKAKSFDEVFKGKLLDTVYNFMMVLIEKNRIKSYSFIADEFVRLYNDKFGIVEITAITAKPLSDELKTKLIEKLEKVSSKRITLIEKVDSTILGGIMLSYNNTQIDASISTKLDAMRSKINSIIA